MSDANPNEQPTPTPTPAGDDEEATPTPDNSGILEKGRFAVHEDGDNAIAVSDDDFIGATEEYQNYGLDVLQPYAAEEGPEKALEERAKEYAERMKVSNVGRHGFDVSDTVHPSKRRQPAAEQIDQNRRISAKAAK